MKFFAEEYPLPSDTFHRIRDGHRFVHGQLEKGFVAIRKELTPGQRSAGWTR
jgi:hypothetical protein